MIGYFLSSIVRFELNETLPLVSFFWTAHTTESHPNCTPESLTLMRSMGMSDVRRTRKVHNGDLSISLVFQHATFLYFSGAINSIGRAAAPSVPRLTPITANQRKYPLPALYTTKELANWLNRGVSFSLYHSPLDIQILRLIALTLSRNNSIEEINR